MPTQQSAHPAAAPELEPIERLFAEHDLSPPAAERALARALALDALGGCADRRQGARLARIVLAELSFAAVAVELARDEAAQRALVERLASALDVSQEQLSRQLLSLPALAAFAPAVVVETTLGLLCGLARVDGVSLWRDDRAGSPHTVDAAGERAGSAERELADRLLRREREAELSDGELHALAIERDGRAIGVLVARVRSDGGAPARTVLRAALPALASALERDDLMARNVSDERALVAGGERRLMRLGFDLHDGPLQELLLLAEDLRLFRGQLVDLLGEHDASALVRGRLDDLDARLLALEGGLRRISTSVHASVLADRPFGDALRDVVQAFSTRSAIVPAVRLQGDSAGVSPSQRIALLSVVGEALNNVREHGETATAVTVEIDFDAHGVSARVVDDGCGFDVEGALLSAARRGRMGLAGIHERVRLLGGRCVVDSRPGGPTSVTLSLPRWEPLASAEPTAVAR